MTDQVNEAVVERVAEAMYYFPWNGATEPEKNYWRGKARLALTQLQAHFQATHPSRGVVDGGQRDRVIAAFRTMLKSSEPTDDADSGKDCTLLPMPIEDFGHTMRIAMRALQAAALPAVPDGMVLVPKHYAENVGYAAVMLEGSESAIDRLQAPALHALVKLLAATQAHDQPEGEG